jgi:DmsE family decaheme c-type cytochrome
MKTGESPSEGERPNVEARRWRGGARALERPWRRVWIVALLAGLIACVSQWSPPQPEGYHRSEPVRGAGDAIGAEHCYDCHDSFEGHLASTAGHSDCEACHGPAQLHAYSAKAGDIRFPSSQDCAACHQIGSRTLLGWSTSEHDRSGVACSDCHDTHNRELWHVREAATIEGAIFPHAGGTTRMCVSCHAEVAAEFDLPSHHPMREGMVGCTDCHSAHENKRATLGADTQTCLSCHQEVAGPWVYEHAPVTEDCGYCHSAHGSTADFLLEASQPAVCISCHTLPTAGAVHDPYAFTTGCTDCHSAIHGSFADPHLRK